MLNFVVFFNIPIGLRKHAVFVLPKNTLSVLKKPTLILRVRVESSWADWDQKSERVGQIITVK